MSLTDIPGFHAAERYYSHMHPDDNRDEGCCKTCHVPLNDADGAYCPACKAERIPEMELSDEPDDPDFVCRLCSEPAPWTGTVLGERVPLCDMHFSLSVTSVLGV